MRTTNTPPRLTTLYLMAALSPLTLNMIAPSLANIADDLRADYALISLALGGYLAVTAVAQLGIGPLSDRIGRRPVLLTAVSVFTLGSLGCAMSQDATVFLAFRMLQAGAIACSVLSMAIVRDTQDGPHVSAILSRIAMAMAVAPMLGPMVGSALDATFGWRAVFILYAAAGAGLLCLLWLDLGETAPVHAAVAEPSEHRLVPLLTDPLFWSYVFSTALSVGGFFVFIAGAPLIASAVFGVTTTTVGLIVGSITAGYFVGSFLSSRLALKHLQTTIMLWGRLVACGGALAGLGALALGASTPLLYFGFTVFVGLGNGLTLPNSNAGAMSVRPRLAGTAAGISGATTLALGAVLTTATAAALSDRPSAEGFLIILLLVCTAGLVAAISAKKLEQRAAQIAAR